MSSQDQLRDDAAKLRDEINNVIKVLKEHHHRVNIAKTASCSASVIGGVAFLTGALLAVPTAGLSLVAAGAGAAVAGVGGVTSIGTSLAEYIIEKINISDIQQNWEKFQKDLATHYIDKLGSDNAVKKIFECVRDIIKGTIPAVNGYQLMRETIIRANQQTDNAWRAAVNDEMAAANFEVAEVAVVNIERTFDVERAVVNVGLAAQVVDAGRGVGNVVRVGRAALQGIKAVGKTSFVLNTVMLPINVIDLVHSISALRGDQSSDASTELERMADFLDRVAKNKL